MPAQAQTFCGELGGASHEYAGDITAGTDNFYIAGRTFSFTPDFAAYYLASVSDSGTLNWTKVFTTGQENVSRSLLLYDHSNLYLAGSAYTLENNYDVSLVHTDTAGNLLWAKFYGDALPNESNKIIRTQDDGLALAGYTDTSLTMGAAFEIVYQPMIMKLDSAGNLQWVRRFTFCDTCTGQATDMYQLQDGSYIVGGNIQTAFGAFSSDLFLARFDSNGNMLWLHLLGKEAVFETGAHIVQASGGGTLIAGSCQEAGSSVNMYISELNEEGDPVWQKTIDFGGYDDVSGLQYIPGDKYAIAGNISNGDYNFGLVITDSSLNILAAASAGTVANDYSTACSKWKQSAFLEMGTTIPEGADAEDLYFASFDSSGTGCCAEAISGTVAAYDGIIRSGGYFAAASFGTTSGILQLAGGTLNILCMDTVAEDTTTLQIQDQHSGFQCAVSPNPAEGILHLRIQEPEAASLQISVYDVAGKLVQGNSFDIAPGEHDYSLNASRMMPGIYFLHVSDGQDVRVLQCVVR